MKRLLFLLLALTCLAPRVHADDTNDLVEDAEFVIKTLLEDSRQSAFRSMLAEAYGVMIIPSYVKAGLVWGGAGGTGVLLSHDREKGEWSAPVFYSLASASVGLQIGVSSSEVVMVIMNQRGLRAMMKNKVKLGADLSVAAGPVGMRGETATSGNLVADIYSYARSRGLFAGVSLEGGIVRLNNTHNKKYYLDDFNAEQILLKHQGAVKYAPSLRAVLARAGKSD
ncbi:lipid-binding SYLF domain-containing protein [Sulfuriflexus sp.]|uniref:lipid-binding SYLF domain-containing protein n=1 Tax=Sulfuriflexus sp. TaxID=2015443 RepID=UPI0028CF1027|nr:lipid-binding SYLF domain-containing protein [Sulfuriflexus sp.]MDT8404693.1 lipid-binding SYLF domain-containing protein [Sulfuriflexus sp.]